MPNDNANLGETKLVLSEWKTVITTQMHFNDMIMRTRTTGVSVVMGVYGAAALALGQYPEKFLKISKFNFHVSAAIIIFGILLLASIASLDYLYYYQMLLAAVKRGEQIDAAYCDRLIDGTKLFGMTTLISQKASRSRAGISLLIFYGGPFIAGVFSLIYLFCFY